MKKPLKTKGGLIAKSSAPKSDLDSGYPRLRFIGRARIRELATGEYPPVQTTFFTDKGPAVRSIWFNKRDKSGETLIVKAVEGKGIARHSGIVRYIDNTWDYLANFMEAVQLGQYVLVGIVTHPECETAT